MVEKMITLYKSYFTDEEWSYLCDEFDADTEWASITFVIDANSVTML